MDLESSEEWIYRQEGAAGFGAVVTLDASRSLGTPPLPGFTPSLAELFV